MLPENQHGKESAKRTEEEWSIDESIVRIVCAAIRHPVTGALVLGPRHYDSTMHEQIRAIIGQDGEYDGWRICDQGFIDQFGRFHNRYDAMDIARFQGQLRNDSQCDELYSEDLY